MSVTDEKKKIASRVRQRRLELWAANPQYTQEWVAGRLGVTGATYSRWESGKFSITAECLSRLADVLDIDVVYFYGRDPFRLADGSSIVRETSVRYGYDTLDPEDKAEVDEFIRFKAQKAKGCAPERQKEEAQAALVDSVLQQIQEAKHAVDELGPEHPDYPRLKAELEKLLDDMQIK